MLSLISHRVKNVEDGIGATHEVRVIGIDVGIFYGNEVLYHLVARLERLVKKGVHDFDHSFSKVLEPVELRKIDLRYNASKLFVYKLHALKRRGLQTMNLLF